MILFDDITYGWGRYMVSGAGMYNGDIEGDGCGDGVCGLTSSNGQYSFIYIEGYNRGDGIRHGYGYGNGDGGKLP